jgi:dCTP deaminase
MVMPCQYLQTAVSGAAPIIHIPEEFPLSAKQIQPASIDLRLGQMAFRMWAAALPHDRYVTDLIEQGKKYDFALSEHDTNALEVGAVYLIPLLETCALPNDKYIEFSPKSSTGRSDVFCRVLCDNWPHYDRTPPGYHGMLYLEVMPLSFDVRICCGLSLVQGRLKNVGDEPLNSNEITDLHMESGILLNNDGAPLNQKDLMVRDSELFLHIDLKREIVGFSAKSTITQALDLTKDDAHEPDDYWVPIRRPKNGELVLVPGIFYLLVTRERTRIPSRVCGQIPSYSPTIGEVRTHYAGFFDPGFGGIHGSSCVLEMRARDTPFTFTDGQAVCSMNFERMSQVPTQLYAGNYDQSGPSLSKHFKERYDSWEKPYWRKLWN